MKDKIKLFLSKIKTNKTAKVSTVVACCVVLMMVAVSIAVGASVKRAPATAAKSGSPGESAQLAEAIEQTFSTTFAPVEPSTTIPATNTTDPVSEPAETTKKATEKATGKTTPKKSSTSSGKVNSSSGSSGASSSTPKPNTGSSNQKPVTATQAQGHQWTQAEVDAIVSEMKVYAKSKGFTINSTLTTKGTAWRNPATTESLQSQEKVESRLIYLIDQVYDLAVKEVGYFPSGAALNIVSQKYTDSNGHAQWEIYVVY